jgi:NADH-quinone oxidoreductase subunit C/D
MIAAAPVVPDGSRSPDAIALPELRAKFPDVAIVPQETQDDVPTFWVPKDAVRDVLRHLKTGIDRPYKLLYDITAIDERARTHREGQPASDFTVLYHLLSFDRNADVRIKVGLPANAPSVPSIAGLWKNADWYERETFDMFGVKFDGHPNLRRILMPDSWEGHPLRKEHPARATEMGPFTMPEEKADAEMDALLFHPEDWGMSRKSADTEFMFLNIGPQHPGTHGVLRIVLQLDGEEIVDAVAEIGYHHRGAEKMAERQSWHTYIPYTDRIDYLGGVMNNLPYLMAVERLAGITIPDRGKVIRIMMCELFRIASHLVWYGTFAQDIGAMSPVFYLFNDRERAFDIVSAVTGGRMHPNWFRIGGTAQDLPEGWYAMFDEFTKYLLERLAAYDEAIVKNQIFIARTKGVGAYTLDEAIEWGITGAGLRANGFEWDFRKMRPYAGYDQFEFDIPTTTGGDAFARAIIRIEEMRQSARIIRQCMENMPAGPYKSDHPLTTPPLKEHTMKDIETLINHFLGVSWGPVVPPGEAFQMIEATKGANSYQIISDGGIHSYRTRIRTPSFPHIQMLPAISRGLMVPDLLVVIGSIDFVLADIDR